MIWSSKTAVTSNRPSAISILILHWSTRQYRLLLTLAGLEWAAEPVASLNVGQSCNWNTCVLTTSTSTLVVMLKINRVVVVIVIDNVLILLHTTVHSQYSSYTYCNTATGNLDNMILHDVITTHNSYWEIFTTLWSWILQYYTICTCVIIILCINIHE